MKIKRDSVTIHGEEVPINKLAFCRIEERFDDAITVAVYCKIEGDGYGGHKSKAFLYCVENDGEAQQVVDALNSSIEAHKRLQGKN